MARSKVRGTFSPCLILIFWCPRYVIRDRDQHGNKKEKKKEKKKERKKEKEKKRKTPRSVAQFSTRESTLLLLPTLFFLSMVVIYKHS